MITTILGDVETHHNWNALDENGKNFFGRIPVSENEVSLTLTWRKHKESTRHLVGRFKLDMQQLLDACYVRVTDGHYILRFQRSGELIEIATNRSSPSIEVTKLPASYKK